MAVNKKLVECTELTTAPAADDALYIVDVDDTTDDPTGTSKFIEWLNAIKFLFGSRYAADAGASDTYTATLVPAPAAYETGEHYRFKANTANTGVCTINFNALGAKTIKKAVGGITTDLADNDIRAGQWVDLVYDGTNMQMQSTLGNAQGGAPTGSAGGDLAGTYPNPRVSQVNDANGNELLKFGTTASAVNEVTVTNKATGTGPTIEATGGDTNINLNLVPKGTGELQYNGTEVGFRNIPQNSQSAAYTTVLADRGKHIFHPSSDANARTFTIDSNANVAYPIGTAITFINMTSQVVTIAITSDTMYLAGTGTTGSRSLAQYGVATAIKIDTTLWIISGTGLT